MGKGIRVIYLDSSCLLRILRVDQETESVLEAVARETSVVISVLCELECMVQLKAFHLAGEYSRPRWRQMEARLSAMRHQPPFEFRSLPAALFPTAFRQHRNAGDVHCRSLERLNLAAMEELGINRLMTHDARQATAALALGHEVVQPGRP